MLSGVPVSQKGNARDGPASLVSLAYKIALETISGPWAEIRTMGSLCLTRLSLVSNGGPWLCPKRTLRSSVLFGEPQSASTHF